MTADLTEAQLKTSPVPGEWSATAVLAHLRSCAGVWGNSIATILRQEQATLRATSPRQWIKRTNYTEIEFAPSLAAFTTQRDELLRTLDALPEAAWSLSITVTGAGRPVLSTVHSYADRLAQHESTHIKQIARIASAVDGTACRLPLPYPSAASLLDKRPWGKAECVRCQPSRIWDGCRVAERRTLASFRLQGGRRCGLMGRRSRRREWRSFPTRRGGESQAAWGYRG